LVGENLQSLDAFLKKFVIFFPMFAQARIQSGDSLVEGAR
jgi:hypothetical protein